MPDPIMILTDFIVNDKPGDIKQLIYDMIKICHAYRYSIAEEQTFREVIRHLSDDLYTLEVEVAKIRQNMADGTGAGIARAQVPRKVN